MKIQEAYVSFTSKMADDFAKEADEIMPLSVKENIARFFEKAKAKVAEKRNAEIEEVPEGAF